MNGPWLRGRTRRAAVATFGVASAVLLLTSLAAACTGISPSGAGHYLQVVPDVGPPNTVIQVAAGFEVGLTEGCPDPAPTHSQNTVPCTPTGGGNGDLYRSVSYVPNSYTNMVNNAVFDNPAAGCTVDIGTVSWNAASTPSGDQGALVVTGSGTMTAQTGLAPGNYPYYVCAAPHPSILWGWFLVTIV